MGTRIRSSSLKLLSLLLLLVAVLLPTTFATGGGVNHNGTGENVGGGTGIGDVQIVNSWSNPPKGYRFYAVTEGGETVSKIVDMWFGDGTANEVVAETTPVEGLRESKYVYGTRAGMGNASINHTPLEKLINSSGNNQIPEPFQGFSQGGTALKAWIYATEDGQEICNGLRLIRGLFGSEVFERYYNTDEEMYIIIETLTMFDMLNGRNQRVGVYAGSAYGWGIMCDILNQPYGNSYLRRGTNGVFAVSLMLEETWDRTNTFNNMKVPTKRTVGGSASAGTWISAEQMKAYGYGTHEYTFSSLMTQMTHTWDKEGCGNTPGPAPKVEEDLEDKVGIVKVYCTKDPETNTVISWDGSYFRDNNPRTIVVEDEEDYKVEEWYTSKVRGTSAPGTWPATKGVYPGSVQGPSGGPGTVILDPDKPTFERTLCVLLVKYPEEEELESELIIEESEISIYRKIREVSDFNLSDTKIESVPKVPNIRDKV